MVHFYLGAKELSWLSQLEVPLFISRRRLQRTRRVKHLHGTIRPRGRPPCPTRANVEWALDSGGFTELSMHGEWRLTPQQYVDDVHQFRFDIGKLGWVAPQDWMCEPSILNQTGLTVQEHQLRTVENFVELREHLGDLVIPVVQGWTLGEYAACLELYSNHGVDLTQEPRVGVGSICRRGQDHELFKIVSYLYQQGIQMHGFGVRGRALQMMGQMLLSADSMAWCYGARRSPPLPGCTHRTCQSCPKYALQWRETLLAGVSE